MTAIQKNVDEMTQAGDAGDAGGQYLTFMLAGEEYGVEILKVQEIKGWDDVTPIPNTPEYVLGVLNLRGAVVPVADNLDDIRAGDQIIDEVLGNQSGHTESNVARSPPGLVGIVIVFLQHSGNTMPCRTKKGSDRFFASDRIEKSVRPL